jgi:hypothetical protein
MISTRCVKAGCGVFSMPVGIEENILIDKGREGPKISGSSVAPIDGCWLGLFLYSFLLLILLPARP